MGRPGVTVVRGESAARVLPGAGVGIKVFIGKAAEGDNDVATLITSWKQYTDSFGEFKVGATPTAVGLMPNAVYSAFNNGMNSCYIIKVDGTEGADFVGDTATKTGICAMESVNNSGILVVCAPDAVAISGDTDFSEAIIAFNGMIAYAEDRGDMFVVVDSPNDLDTTEVQAYFADITPSSYQASYYPWLVVIQPDTVLGSTIELPPSFAVAGIMSKVESNTGVWVAPAGVDYPIQGITDVVSNITDGEQDILNEENINVIRKFTGYGIVVWGVRTTSADTSWKYVNTQLTDMQVRKTLLEDTKWVVFKNNDEDLWQRIRISVSNYLTRLWQAGGLKGATPSEAFFVKCDADLNTASEIEAGRVNIQVGCAYQKPAEFVTFTVSQWSSGSSIV